MSDADIIAELDAIEHSGFKPDFEAIADRLCLDHPIGDRNALIDALREARERWEDVRTCRIEDGARTPLGEARLLWRANGPSLAAHIAKAKRPFSASIQRKLAAIRAKESAMRRLQIAQRQKPIRVAGNATPSIHAVLDRASPAELAALFEAAAKLDGRSIKRRASVPAGRRKSAAIHDFDALGIASAARVLRAFWRSTGQLAAMPKARCEDDLTPVHWFLSDALIALSADWQPAETDRRPANFVWLLNELANPRR